MGLKPNIIMGAGGGGSSSTKTPTESPDTLRSIASFRILDLLGEGEIGGLVNGLQSVYLNQTPVANPDGSLNFTGVHVETRAGTADQDYIADFSAVENEISVGIELKSSTDWVQAISDISLTSVRITLAVLQLQKTDTKTGDIVGYSVQYAIDVAADNGAYQTMVTSAFSGKTTDEYQRSHQIALPKATTGWTVRVRRLTANANSATIADTTQVVSYTEIIDVKLRYPYSALVAISGDAQQFSNIPTRAYDCWLSIISVPSNYDPTARTYSGAWDGSFKQAWTDNPAWVYYDMATNDRFGLGDVLNAATVDKWALYQIAQYCDQLVSDGKGGQEPRFACNCFLQTQEDAYKLMGDLASIFRGVSYWAGGTVQASADMPSDPVFIYTAAKVINGKFTYQSSALSTRFTTAQVTWNDPSNMYNQAVEYVEDRAGLARYGINNTAFVAFGCTSQGQAQRAGQWALLTSRLETDSVTFQVGLEGLTAAPGQIIGVQDAARAGARQGGLISAATLTTITVDRAPDAVAVGDTLLANMPDGTLQSRTITGIAGRELQVTQPFTQVPSSQSTWAVESATLALQTFRVLAVSEDDSASAITFTITAIQHNASKFAAIDDGTIIQIPPISRLPTGLQDPPTGVTISSNVVVAQGIATNVMTIAWAPPKNGATYQVEWQKDGGQWIPAGTVSTTSIDIPGVYTGSYVARVTAYNVGNVPSLPAYSTATAVQGKTGAPPSLTSLRATALPFGIALDWGFPAGTEDTQRTELWASTNPVRPDADGTIAYAMGDYAYPGNHTELHGLSAGASLYFWGRLVDKTGNIGPWYPATGAVNGQSISDPNQLQDYWAGTIGRSALEADLLSQIDALITLTPVVWSAAATYVQNQTVIYDGVIYSWGAASAGNETPPGTHWINAGQAIAQSGALVGQVAQNTTDIASLNGEVTAQGTSISGLVAQVTTRGAGDAIVGAGDTTSYAGTVTIQSVAANATLAQAQRIDQVTVSLGDANAAIQTESTARAAADMAIATQITTVQASIANTNASVQTTAQALANLNGTVSSSYVVQTSVAANGQRFLSGIAIGVDYSGGVATSMVLVNAGTFAVFDATSGTAPATYPFVIQGGQTFINQALIGTGWITNAMIGNTIQSTSVNAAGAPTWQINKAGSIVLSGDAFTITHNSTGMVMTNTAGVRVVELGLLS